MEKTDLSTVDVVNFLIELNIRNVREQGPEVQYSCPFPEHAYGDRHPSATMQKGTTQAYCFSCGWRGNAVTFLADVEGISPIKAMQEMKERFCRPKFREPESTVLEELNKKLTDDKPVPRVPDIEECWRREIEWHYVQDAYEKMTTEDEWNPLYYLLERGFKPQALMDFQVGWDPISQMICIPVFSITGELVGFKGRTPFNDVFPKYRVLGGDQYGFDEYETSKVVFGLWDVIEMGRYGKTKYDIEEIIVCEGELNAVAMHGHGYINAVGISGKYLSDHQASLLAQAADKAILIFDERKDAISAAARLERRMKVRIVAEHERDPADSYTEEIEALVSSAESSLLAS